MEDATRFTRGVHRAVRRASVAMDWGLADAAVARPVLFVQTIHCLYIFNGKGACLYYREWNRPHSTLADNPSEDRKLLFGLHFSLKKLIEKLSPTPYVATRRVCPRDSARCVCPVVAVAVESRASRQWVGLPQRRQTWWMGPSIPGAAVCLPVAGPVLVLVLPGRRLVR